MAIGNGVGMYVLNKKQGGFLGGNCLVFITR